ncbi:hypothetical protein [Alkalicoccobacillus gibsonii]|uniref:hypothetical protein n=1 Tax=Alkalicoccobacillus gibsonii TaxID=79881 RepID=UPI00351591C0
MKDNWTRHAKVTNVFSDSVFMGTLHLLPNEVVLNNQAFRLWDVQDDPNNKAGKKFLETMIHDKNINVTIHGKDDFGYWLVEVYNDISNQSINESLFQRKIATRIE